MALEYLDNGNPEGCIARGRHRPIITGWTTARQLLASESGSLITFDTAAGQTCTLPTPVAGMEFEFAVHVTGTGTYSVATGSAAIFIGGGVDSSSTTVAEGGDTFVANPAATVDVVMDSDVTGRLVGGWFTLTAISSTVWNIRGTLMGVGTLATPF
jgi:hypothetical protein